MRTTIEYDRQDNFFRLVRGSDLKGLKAFFAPMSEYAKQSMIISQDPAGNTALYYAAGWSSAMQGIMIKNLDMLKFLMNTILEGKHHGYSIPLHCTHVISRINFNVIATYDERYDLIHVSGRKVLNQDGSTGIADPWFAFLMSTTTADREHRDVKVFNISYDINSNGQIVNYISTEEPHIAARAGIEF